MYYIFAAAIGVLLGNFLTSVLYRLPRGILVQNFLSYNVRSKPYCSQCSHPLKYYEYLPVLSWMTTRGKCNYCGGRIDIRYICCEILMCLASVYLYYKYSISEIYLLLLFTTACMLLLVFLAEERYSSPIFRLAVVLGMIYNTLVYNSVIAWAFSSVVYLFVVALLFRMHFIKTIPSNVVKMGLLASIWGWQAWPVNVIIIALIPYWISRRTNINFYTLSIMLLYQVILSNV